MRTELFLIPGSVSEERLAGKTLVMIDVLRASTTICQSLRAGARAVIPVERPGEAAELRSKLGVEDTILGGERKGIKIDNFDLGNSPLEYTEERVKGKVVILTTSNGTQGYARANASKLIITAGLVNISRVARKVAEAGQDVAIICAGEEGDFSIEDTLCGGMLIERLLIGENLDMELNDAASLALLLYRSNKDRLKQTIAHGEHGRYLKQIGFDDDVRLATEADSIAVLPVLKDRRIVLDES
nr:2-phosphosulfolactate phosphatase [candidate division Zixibacteria bacterium]